VLITAHNPASAGDYSAFDEFVIIVNCLNCFGLSEQDSTIGRTAPEQGRDRNVSVENYRVSHTYGS